VLSDLAATDLHEHICDAVNATFVTGLNTCPVCDERLDIAPAFPSLVAGYLKRTKAANKINVTFDYDSGTFVPVEDGEFVVITNLSQPVILPRAAKFSSKRDFYEFYQDYYHCPNPDTGDVQIVQPAFVADSGNGWNLIATGILEVVKPQPKKPVAPVIQPPVAPVIQPPTVKREEPVIPEPVPVVTAKKKEAGARACPDCGSMIEEKYAFCWKCGHALEGERKPGKILSSSDLDLDDDEMTVQHERRPFNSSVLPWTTAKAQEHPSTSRGSVLKLIAIGAIALLLVSLGLFGLFRSNTQTASATAAPQPVVQASQPQSTVPVTTEVSRSAPSETTTQQQVTPKPEDELKKLREQRISAKPSERPKLYQALAKVEKQYPRDYRFPYERAKLAMTGSHSSAAFKALNAAAEKAIQSGKTGEMLSGLEEDKQGDFSKISQARSEWSRLVAALKRKDTSLLSE